MRSYYGCTTCRKRKLKCDESKPRCGQCVKSGRGCIFSDDFKFRHFTTQALDEQTSGEISGHEDRNSPFGKDQVWLYIPSDLTFVNIVNPFETEDTILSEVKSPQRHRGSLSEGDNPLLSPHESESELAHSIMNGVTETPSSSHNPEPLVGSPSCVSTNVYADDHASSSHPVEAGTWGFAPLNPRLAEGEEAHFDERSNDPEANVLALQLIRHFREGPGQWMDLFDTSAYFSRKIPIRAATCPLLKSAICALAAKHLSRTGNSDREKQNSHSARNSQASPVTTTVLDWQYHAVRYYHHAVRCLKDVITLDGCDETREPSDSIGSVDIFAAVAILCIYELMDAPGNAWKAHLTVLPLYGSTSDSNANGSSPVPIPNSQIKGPIFWSLARQDFLYAFLNETQTRLNLEHVRLWQNFGLATDVNNLLLPFSPFCTADLRPSADVEEDTKSNELLWLLGKVVNYITSGDSICSEDFAKSAGQRMAVGLTQEIILEKWSLLETELKSWFEGLSQTFFPSARTQLTVVRDNNGYGPVCDVEKVWYDIPMCAATIQFYHMGCILLLVNRPQESTAIRSTVSSRLRSYRHIQKEVRRHALEICGISLADPTASVRIHSVQPLFVAGQSLHEPQYQKLVIELLSGIETELGWATNYQISKLKDEWQVV